MTTTIAVLTIRQFLRARSIYVLIGICLLGALFAAIQRFAPAELSPRDKRDFFGDTLFLEFFAATLLPLGILVLATAALGDEIEDRTLQYLALKPVSRFKIVIEKLLAVFTITIPIVFAGVALMWAIISYGSYDGTRDMLTPALLASLVAIVGFGSIFLLLSLVIQRALLVGVFYVFVWETALSRFLPGINAISIRHFSQSLFVRLVDDRRIAIDDPSAQTTVIVATAAILAVCIALGTLRLRSMSLE